MTNTKMMVTINQKLRGVKMLQNISEKYNQVSNSGAVEENYSSEKVNYREVFSKLFTKQKIMIYIVTFMISMCSFGGNSSSMIVSPFGLAMIAASVSYGMPVAIVYIASLLATFIKFGFNATAMFLITSAVMLVLILTKRPAESDDEQEKIKLGSYLFISIMVVSIIRTIIKGFLLYDLLVSVILAVSAYIFYKIFVNSIGVIGEYGNKSVFSIEEVVGASMLLAIAFSSLGRLSLFGFSIRNILCIFLILVLGYRNGILVGGVSGITVGIVLGIIGAGGTNLIATYAISGMLAGLLNRFGKLGVIFGFALGNILISYSSNGGVDSMIMFQEILIASIGLLVVPKNIKISVEDLLPKTKLLPESTGRIEESSDTILKLNSISKTIEDISNNIQKDSSYEENYKMFENKVYKALGADEQKEESNYQEKQNNNSNSTYNQSHTELYDASQNMFYDYLVQDDDKILSDIFENISQNAILTENAMIAILAKHNIYVMTSNDNLQKEAEEKDLREMIKIINVCFNDCKKDLIWQQKINENNIKMSSGLKTVKNAIDNIKTDIQKDEKLEKEDKFQTQIEKIKNILLDDDVYLQDIKIREEESKRKIITCYLPKCIEKDMPNCPIKKIKRTIEGVFNERLTLQTGECALRAEKDNCSCTFISSDRFIMQTAIARAKKDDSIVSGDMVSEARLQDGKYLLAISDGMGSGANARKNSKIAISMLERMLMSGFEKNTSINLINSAILTSNNEDMYATLDVAIVDLYDGKIEILKNGACPTYIKENKGISMISSNSLPTGVMNNVQIDTFEKQINDGDILVMVSDGVIDSSQEYAKAELWVKALLQDIQTDSPERIADIILKETLDNNYGKAKDDITVIVSKINKR